MNYEFWRKQHPGNPLYPDFEWRRPERASDRGHFLIIGGNARGFAAVNVAYKAALEAGAGEVRVLLPDSLASAVPKGALDAIFLPSGQSGGFSIKGLMGAQTALEWASSAIFIGDSGQNSETAVFFEKLLNLDGDISGSFFPLENRLRSERRPIVPPSNVSPTKITITRDAVDLLKNIGEPLMNRPETTLAVSFNQLQKLFQSVYYPKVLTFSQNLATVVENLHKFTTTYPVALELFHKDSLILAHGGGVITQDFSKATDMWTGKIPTRGAVFETWTDDLLEALAASIA
jgi:hypothetical protein